MSTQSTPTAGSTQQDSSTRSVSDSQGGSEGGGADTSMSGQTQQTQQGQGVSTSAQPEQSVSTSAQPQQTQQVQSQQSLQGQPQKQQVQPQQSMQGSEEEQEEALLDALKRPITQDARLLSRLGDQYALKGKREAAAVFYKLATRLAGDDVGPRKEALDHLKQGLQQEQRQRREAGQ